MAKLTKEQVLEAYEAGSEVSAEVEIHLDDITHRDFEEFLDLLSEGVVGEEFNLDDFSYQMVRLNGNKIVFLVEGRVSDHGIEEWL